MLCTKIPGITANGSNGTMTLKLPHNTKVHAAYMALTSGTCTIDKIVKVRVIADGDTHQELTGQELDELNKAAGLDAFATASVLCIPFNLTGMKSAPAFVSTAYNIGPSSPTTGKSIAEVRVEVDIVGATNPQFEAYCDTSASTSEGPGAVLRRKRYVEHFTAGEVGITDMDFGDSRYQLWHRIAIKAPAGTLSKVRIAKATGNGASSEEFNAIVAVNNTRIKNSTSGRAVGAYFGFIADLDSDGVDNFIDTAGKDMTLHITDSASEDGVILLEAVGSL